MIQQLTEEVDPTKLPSILVVDDDAAIRELVADLLADSGFSVSEAPDGKKAVQHIRRNPVDLVITDIVMPDQDGLETILQLRKEFPRIRVIAMSGYQGGTYLHHARLLGACATVRKPFSVDTILQTVLQVLHPQAPPLPVPADVDSK